MQDSRPSSPFSSGTPSSSEEIKKEGSTEERKSLPEKQENPQKQPSGDAQSQAKKSEDLPETVTPAHQKNSSEKSESKKKEEASPKAIEPENIDEELLEDQEGDLFWIFQKVLWSILKIGVVIGFIIFLIWVIWNPQDNPLSREREEMPPISQTKPSQKKPPQSSKKQQEKKTRTPSADSSLVFSRDQTIFTAGQWHQWIRDLRQYEQRGVVFDSWDWIIRAESFFDIPAQQWVSGETREKRTTQIQQLTQSIRSLLEESLLLREGLVSQIQELNQSIEIAQGEAQEASRTLQISLRDLDQPYSESDVLEKIQAEQNIVAARSQQEIRRYLLGHMEAYDRSFRQVYENIVANRDALVAGIRVVNFPGDPLDRILTPSEWRARQEISE